MNIRVTIADVARVAAVSTQTVSRAINNKGEIRPETRQHVLAIAERMGYQPNTLARALASDRTWTLGLVVPDVTNPYFAEIIRGAEDAALPYEYSIFLCNTNEDPQRERKLLSLLESKRVDGVIICSPALSDDTLIHSLARQRFAIIVNHPPVGNVVGAIWVDNLAGTRQAVEHLLADGRQQIGLIYGTPETFSRRQRCQAYKETLVTHGIAVDPALLEACAPQLEDGHRAARCLLERMPTLDALVCHNDLVAVGALQACAELGRRVPIDVAVIGFDNIPLSQLIWPKLTTLHYPIAQLGGQAVEMLLQHVDRETEPLAFGSAQTGSVYDGPQQICVTPQLIIRESAP